MKKTGLPTIKTKNLILRRIYSSDLALFEALTDPEVSKYECWSRHISIEETMAYINSVMDKLDAGTCTEWVIEHKEDGYPIGMVNLHDIYTQHRRAELGFWLNRRYWNKGYATEAAAAVMKYAFEQLGIERLQSLCYPGNAASVRVLEKLGMKPEAVHKRYMCLSCDPKNLSDVAVFVKFAAN